ncbi:DoxX family protein [Xanthobacter sp. TB0136]|uniref:DoxX family protein n=1 Tax=Xanthobacter sp. TB0136 TaxID=3459177 RepID=UPI0040391C29
MKQSLNLARPYILSILRIVLGLVMFAFGMAKIFHFHPGPYTPAAGSLPWIAGWFELVLGFVFLLGFQTRIVAFVLSGLMASAYFIAHFPKSFFPTENGGSLAVVLSFVFLYFVTSGAGPISLDAALGKKTD